MKNNRFKKSIDFEESSVRLMELYRQEKQKMYKTKIPYSYIINELVNKFIFMDKSIKLALLNTCEEELENLDKEIIDINSYSGMKKYERKKHYIELIKFFTDEETIVEECKEEIKKDGIEIDSFEIGQIKEIQVCEGDVDCKSKINKLSERDIGYILAENKYLKVLVSTLEDITLILDKVKDDEIRKELDDICKKLNQTIIKR